MLSCDPERNWFRIAKASLISSTRPALTSVSAPFPMTRRLPLPARRTFASIDKRLARRHNGPYDPRELVGERHRDQSRGFAREKRDQPIAQGAFPLANPRSKEVAPSTSSRRR